jgi:hypothetical protein
MGRTYYKSSKNFDDGNTSGSSGKPARHANGRKTGGMRTINNYVEEDYDDYDLNDNSFDEEVELDDEISIQHNTNTK